MRDLRISVTDRCNFRCSYCMPKELFDRQHAFLAHKELLSFEEITRLARVFVAQGVRKIRLTGGEPLLRKDLERLVEMLSRLRTSEGQAVDLTLTTNGSVLAKKAQALRDAGLSRLAVSVDAIDDAIFRRMNDVDFPVADVLEGIEAATRAGFAPIKINMVVRRGTNDSQILPMAEHFRGSGAIVRFIEFMDVGTTNGWRMDEVLPSAELIALIHAQHPLEALEPTEIGETAQRWRYRDGAGEIGVISSVTRAFCRACTRLRLSTEGQVYLCLFAHRGHDLRALLRSGCDDEHIAATIAQIWSGRDERYSELRGSGEAKPDSGVRRIEMHYIGG